MDSNKDNLYIGIDLGTSSCKMAVVDQSGTIVSISIKSYALHVSDGGFAEQNPEDWYKAVLDGMKEITSKVEIKNIRSIGVTGQWSGTVPVDQNCNALHPAIVWMDTRGESLIKKITGGFPSISGYRIDKLVKWIRATGGAPAHSGKDSLAHILYIKNELPELYSKTYKFLEPKDYIVAKLTGSIVASWDDTALLWATNNRDASKIVYDAGLIKMNGIDIEKLPDLVSPVSVVGNVVKEVSDITGIPEDVKVISGCGDTQCSLIGVGAVQDFDIHVYLGTSSWITSHVPFKKTDIFHNVASLPSAIPSRYFIAAEQENACNCVEYISSLLSIDGNDKYDTINSQCKLASPGSNNLIFLPWLFGERTPIEDSFARGGFFNMGLNNTRSDMIRSVFEGVAMNSKWLLGIVEKFTGREADNIYMAGGGALSDIWPQIYADVLNKKISVVDNPRYSTVRGIALLSAVGSGYSNMESIGMLKKTSKEYVPEMKNVEVYKKLYNEFIKYYNNNHKSMRSLNMKQPLLNQE